MNHTTCTTRDTAGESFTWENLLEAKRLIEEAERAAAFKAINAIIPSEFVLPTFCAVAGFRDARNTATLEYHTAYQIKTDDYEKPVFDRLKGVRYEKKTIMVAHPWFIEEARKRYGNP